LVPESVQICQGSIANILASFFQFRFNKAKTAGKFFIGSGQGEFRVDFPEK